MEVIGGRVTLSVRRGVYRDHKFQTDFRRPINWFACHFEVRDAADDVLLEFPFSEAVEVKQPTN